MFVRFGCRLFRVRPDFLQGRSRKSGARAGSDVDRRSCDRDVGQLYRNAVHADRCAWTYGLKGDAAPDAAAIFANGTAVSADQPSDVTIPDLTPGTTYVAYAVAASGEHAGEVESIDLPTVALSYDVDYTAQYAQG